MAKTSEAGNYSEPTGSLKMGVWPAESMLDGFFSPTKSAANFFMLATGVVCSLLSPSLSFFRPPRLMMCPSWIGARWVIDVRGHANVCWCRDKDIPFVYSTLKRLDVPASSGIKGIFYDG
jgi:hypothetical protein